MSQCRELASATHLPRSSFVLAPAWEGQRGLGAAGSLTWQSLLGRIQLEMWDRQGDPAPLASKRHCAQPHGQSQAGGYNPH